MSESSVFITLGLGFIKSIVCIYDLISFPVYAIVQRPWEARQRSRAARAQHAIPNDPSSGMFSYLLHNFFIAFI